MELFPLFPVRALRDFRSGLDADNDGIATVELTAVRPEEHWDIRHLAVSASSAAASAASLHWGQKTDDDATLLDFWAAGNRAVSTYTGLVIAERQILTVRWTGLTPGASVHATFMGLVLMPFDITPAREDRLPGELGVPLHWQDSDVQAAGQLHGAPYLQP
jgi:hypothetical protein